MDFWTVLTALVITVIVFYIFKWLLNNLDKFEEINDEE